MKMHIHFNLYLLAASLMLGHQPLALAFDPVGSAVQQNVINAVTSQAVNQATANVKKAQSLQTQTTTTN
jgi:hypothetical protein